MITDPLFYALAVAAVILIGLSKGGFGGALALLGVPMVALVIPPVQAAAIFLPILVAMDLAGLWAWRGVYHKPTLVIMLPAAVIGMPVGFVGAAESKDALMADGRVPYIVVRGRKGGSAMAVAAINAVASERE